MSKLSIIISYLFVFRGVPVSAINLTTEIGDYIFILMGEELFKFNSLHFSYAFCISSSKTVRCQ